MTSHELQHNILYTCISERKRGGEEIVHEHVLAYVISGEIRFYINGCVNTYGPGTISLLRKNLLIKSTKEPASNGTPFQSLNIFLEQSVLKKYCSEHDIVPDGPYGGEPIIEMSHDSFMKGYFNSLFPYFQSDIPITATMAEIKTKEAIELIIRHNTRLKNMLFDYNEPYKIDLEAFMLRNYIYNIPIVQFARLTGRSLATFKRDFKKLFNDSPERWIQKKRLERAHFLIKEQKQAPVSVFTEVGFENLAHFSTAFKKLFGYSPSLIPS